MPEKPLAVIGATKPLFEETVRVKKLVHEAKDGYTIFLGAKLRRKLRGAGMVETKEIGNYTGYFTSIHPNDVFELAFEKAEDKFYGERRFVITHKRVYPGTLDEIRTFLMSKKKGIGPKRIDLLIERYGLSVLEEIEHNPDAFEGLGISSQSAQYLRDEIVADKAFEDTLAFLQLRRLDYRYASPLFAKYKESTVDILKNNPFAPYLDGIIDFRTADSLHCSMGFPYNAPFRVAMAVYGCLKADSQYRGNLFVDASKVQDLCERFVFQSNELYAGASGFSAQEYADAIRFLAEKELLVTDSKILPGKTCLYLKTNYDSELRIAQYLAQVMNGSKRYSYPSNAIDLFLRDYQAKNGIQLAAKQKKAVFMSLLSPVSILTGGPGTGKTQTINTIIAAIQALSPTASIRLAAPTGKAAQRISELCGRKAYTIHRLLGMGYYNVQSVGAGEMDSDYLIVDEFSMADAYLTYRIFYAASEATRVILVGDYDQLPSVGPGLVLRDLVNSGCIPCVRLTQIFRQAKKSNIIRNAHAIITSTEQGPKEQMWVDNSPGGDFYFIPAEAPSEIREIIIRSIERFENTYHYDPDSIQVLSPLRKPDVGVEPLNQFLQDTMNPAAASYQYAEREFRIGDKVIHCVNNYELGVFNGETGTIKSIGYSSDHALEVAYPDKDVWYGISDMEQLELAYAISVHKSQGSEFPVVILPVHETLVSGLNKNLIYTAITRARKVVVIIGSAKALAEGIKKNQTTERNSNLIQRLRDALPIAPSIPAI